MSKNTTGLLAMPVVALRGLVIFPEMRLHFDVGRSKSVAALKVAMAGNQEVFLVTQKDIVNDAPEFGDLYKIGVVATVKQVLKLQGSENVRVAVEGLYRARLVDRLEEKPFLRGTVKRCPDAKIKESDAEYAEALVRHAKDIFNDYSTAAPQLSPDLILAVIAEKRPGGLADYIAGNIVLEYADRQRILENLNPLRRLESLCVLLEKEGKLLKLEEDIHNHVQEQIDQNQREYYLREQLKAISGELNDGAAPENDIQMYREQIEKLGLDETSHAKLMRECDRLERVSPQSPESGVIRNYLETCLALPWNKLTTDKLDLIHARKVLDNDHYGLEKVKDRIVEMLAVRKLSPDIKGQIICLVGPPGVGKTSVARSIARAMGRKYVRISLGGIHDEAEIRGHRKTYIGAMPGRIINAMQQAGTSNPLILLDEVDKLSSSYNGDPSSALLEVLDSEQNFSFRDHYIELPFDLSRVLFITTANMRDTIPEPLLDRMEIIELGSYTHEEKFNIAKKHLVPKQAKRHGLSGKSFKITDDALHLLIEGYTKEAGVRRVEQTIAAIFRKAAVKVANGETKVIFKAEDLDELLGARKYKNEKPEAMNESGLVNGLAWTSVGGEMLQIEAAVLDGTGKLELTGSLGEVMKESAKAALSYIRSRSDRLHIDKQFYKEKDIHIHVPEGAVPKDGPSAGVTIATALVSALTGIPARADVAMTGEITLRGRVLPIGGLKEKAMAAYRAGIKTVIIPEENVPDLREVDNAVKARVAFVPVTSVDEVFTHALVSDIKKENREELPIPVADNLPVSRNIIAQ